MKKINVLNWQKSEKPELKNYDVVIWVNYSIPDFNPCTFDPEPITTLLISENRYEIKDIFSKKIEISDTEIKIYEEDISKIKNILEDKFDLKLTYSSEI